MLNALVLDFQRALPWTAGDPRNIVPFFVRFCQGRILEDSFCYAHLAKALKSCPDTRLVRGYCDASECRWLGHAQPTCVCAAVALSHVVELRSAALKALLHLDPTHQLEEVWSLVVHPHPR